MLRVQNIISLAMSSGFFIGIMFAILNFSDPVTIIIVTIIVTFSLYIIGVISASFYMKTYVPKDKIFSKEIFDDGINEIADKLLYHEQKINNVLNSMAEIRTPRRMMVDN